MKIRSVAPFLARITIWTGAMAAALLSTAVELKAAELWVTVSGVRNDKGRIVAALHTKRPGLEFPNEDGAIAGQWREAQNGAIEFVFSGLPAGLFAVAAFHDEDADGELDRTLFGIPKEGSGFSENAIGDRGPPPFKAAAVDIRDTDEERVTQVTLRY